MREIKFRGKKVDVDEWISGYLFTIWEESFILWGITNNKPNMTKVIPETVGVSLGVEDINDCVIYEDDLLKRVKSNGTYYKKVYHVKNYSNQSIPRFDPIFFQSDTKFEKIGNIYDNPTLLESVKP